MSSLWEKSALLDGDRLLIACGNEVFCLLLPSLELLWHTQVDMATCFQIVAYQDDYITQTVYQKTFEQMERHNA